MVVLAESVPVTFYDDELDTEPKCVEAAWPSFQRLISIHEESPCTAYDGPAKCIGKECPWKSHSVRPGKPMAFSPVTIEGRRLDKNVRTLTLLVLDFDHLPLDEALRVEEVLAPYEHVRYTTHNHRDSDICFRAVLRISRPVLASEWHRFLAAAVARLGVPADPTCKNRSRLYYLPSHPRGAPHAVEYVSGEEIA